MEVADHLPRVVEKTESGKNGMFLGSAWQMVTGIQPMVADENTDSSSSGSGHPDEGDQADKRLEIKPPEGCAHLQREL